MQEEVESRTLTLVVSGTKFTGRMFKAAISKYMAHRKEKKLENREAVMRRLFRMETDCEAACRAESGNIQH